LRALRIVRNALSDLRFGAPLAIWYLRNRRQANTDYAALESMTFGPIRNEDVLVDIGCGAGRVVNHWLALGCSNRIIGLELDPVLAERTRTRLRRHPNVRIITGDALELLPEDGTIYYLFNPFGAPQVVGLEARLREIGSRRLGGVRVIYHNPKHLDVFRNESWKVRTDSTLGMGLHSVAYLQLTSEG